MIRISQTHVNDLIGHARKTSPHECCGLIGGNDSRTRTVYPLRNIAADPLVTYEAAPEDLFAAQRAMRDSGEQLLAIYHSHPRSVGPYPSETDVRLAYYPAAVYFILGLAGEAPCLRAFRISEPEGRWESTAYDIVTDANH
jgi:proteasome lid subunit RPN8/RPN11